MFQYEYEKRPPSSSSCDSRATVATDWSTPRRAYPPPTPARERPMPCERDSAVSVPLKVWIVASASCFAVCGALVLATIVITRWGSQPSAAPLNEPELVYSYPHPVYITPKPLPTTTDPEPTYSSNEVDNDIEIPIIEKLSIFRNVVANRNKVKKTEDLISKPQIHPVHDTTVEHLERKIEKKDQAKLPSNIEVAEAVKEVKRPIPDFKPTLPDVFVHEEIKLPSGYLVGLRKHDDYEEYYNDDNLYDDYMQSNTMTNYLIEKVQELHDWITTDPDLEGVKNGTKIAHKSTEFSQVLKALNESLVQGNVSIIMNKLKDIYFGDNYTNANHSRKMILSNSTDLLSFGILTLDIMLLHNIQLMAWENQEAARSKMLKDPDVFAFNALFMDPSKVEAKQNEIYHHDSSPPTFSKRQNLRQDVEDFDIGKSLLESFLEVGMSTARAAIHLGRAYKNTKAVLNQLSNRESPSIQAQLSRNIDGNTHALNHLQTSFNNSPNGTYTDLDCVWMLYCKNLVATSKLNAPYGTMARINGMALRMLAGELPTEKALETMVSEALTGWTPLKCDELFPRCSKVNAATVVMDTILQPIRKAQANRL
ncbi:hypothetical protein ABMA27_012219 [Loxostege sticticalis]|uniref:Uncharacterized protein n=1 Tax=Loxostege sticticalis TaxID=481309 RepID=A0ABR3H0I9_LOXSC